ncbi:MAG TPA: ABC transporter permease, partial [Thermoanaerobaculia bacterium]|nr:ABC transporter permease [Thermoanaerobaculia bacterium]
IGLRRALGARSDDIRRQFLCEGLLVGLFGGVLGLLIGASASLTLLSRAGFSPRFDASTILLLSTGAGLFGIASGLRPAADAARLDPGAALRAE